VSITRVQDPTIAHPEYIADLIHESYAGPAWHGPCVVEALAGVDAEAATKRISPHRHSIWELVLHLAHGRHLLIERLTNESSQPFPRAIRESWWPASPTDFSETAWLVDRDLLDDYQERLLAAIRAATPEQLARVPDRSDTPVARQLVGMALHDTYHAGQIKLIALAAGV
jgi:uncharacterized damage-inducible protein DinB